MIRKHALIPLVDLLEWYLSIWEGGVARDKEVVVQVLCTRQTVVISHPLLKGCPRFIYCQGLPGAYSVHRDEGLGTKDIARSYVWSPRSP